MTALPVAVGQSESDRLIIAAPGTTQARESEPHESNEPLDLQSRGPAASPVATALDDRAPREQQAASLFGEAHQDIFPEAALRLEGGVDTRLGGVLYLINLMLRLDLPACFEQDGHLASQVGTWGVLEALGRGLLSADDCALNDDPLWTALAQLDGREPGEWPGQDFCGGENFYLPAEWLAQIANEESEPFDQAQVASLTGTLAADLNPHLARWLAFVLPYIRFRLQRALDPSGTEATDLQTALLLRQGILYVTSTHVDLVMPLADVSTPIRIAGLDCNPGWLPDFGRVVLFHFE
jgi:hypothetical protein